MKYISRTYGEMIIPRCVDILGKSFWEKVGGMSSVKNNMS